jgi:hypothetical protein
MNRFKTKFVLAALMGLLVLIAGCTQLPTEKRGIADIRPQISFKISSESTKTANVILDGLPVGTVGDFVDGVAAIRILPGSHVITVVLGSQIILEEKFYVGDGANRSFVLN